MLCFSISSSLFSPTTLSIVSTLREVVSHLWRNGISWHCNFFVFLYLTFWRNCCPGTSSSWESDCVPFCPRLPTTKEYLRLTIVYLISSHFLIKQIYEHGVQTCSGISLCAPNSKFENDLMRNPLNPAPKVWFNPLQSRPKVKEYHLNPGHYVVAELQLNALVDPGWLILPFDLFVFCAAF